MTKEVSLALLTPASFALATLSFARRRFATLSFTRQFILNWTPRQMDAYLAIPEAAMEWNVEPG
jgi:hypothetical protein